MIWTVLMRFYPRQANPRRASGKGVYRVIACYHGANLPPCTLENPVGARVLRVSSTRQVQIGSRVNPLHLALGAPHG